MMLFFKKQSGFTLIELMIVIVIVSLLAGLALPSYRSQMMKARRADATTSLMDVYADQETWYSQHRSYTSNPSDLNRTNKTSNSFISEQGYYEVVLTSVASSATDSATFEAVATPIGKQTDDGYVFRLNSFNVKRHKKSLDGSFVTGWDY